MLLSVRSHRLALWLALSAMLLRALIPDGFMLGRSAERGGYGLIFCSSSPLHADRADQAGTTAQTQLMHCAFALSAMSGLPGVALALPARLRFGSEAPAAHSQRQSDNGARLRPPARAPPSLS